MGALFWRVGIGFVHLRAISAIPGVQGNRANEGAQAEIERPDCESGLLYEG